MKKYEVMGYKMAKVEDVKWCIRNARKSIDLFGDNKSKEARDFARFILEIAIRNMYKDEIKAAKSEDEKENILEMTGDFIVSKIEETGKNRSIKYFGGFDSGEPIIEKWPYHAMHFDYESMAQQVAEKLGDGWNVIDCNYQEYEKDKSILNRLFSTDEEEAE